MGGSKTVQNTGIMSGALFEIRPYEEKFRRQIISVWERSVRATHVFVLPTDIDHFKEIVEKIDFSSFPVFCLTEGESVRGFLGVEGASIEMLFLDPAYIGRGFGKRLMEFALHELRANRVDVNEQNTRAVRFYSRFGFQAYERTEKDPEGKDYPILKMKRNKSGPDGG